MLDSRFNYIINKTLKEPKFLNRYKSEINSHISQQTTVENHFMILCNAMKKQLILSKEYESALKVCRMELQRTEKAMKSIFHEMLADIRVT